MERFFAVAGAVTAMIGVIVVCGLLLKILPADRPHPDAAPPTPLMELLRALRGPLGVIFVISALSGFLQRLFLTLSPIISSQDGVSEAIGALVLTVYLAGQAIGTLVWGAYSRTAWTAPTSSPA